MSQIGRSYIDLAIMCYAKLHGTKSSTSLLTWLQTAPVSKLAGEGTRPEQLRCQGQTKLTNPKFHLERKGWGAESRAKAALIERERRLTQRRESSDIFK